MRRVWEVNVEYKEILDYILHVKRSENKHIRPLPSKGRHKSEG